MSDVSVARTEHGYQVAPETQVPAGIRLRDKARVLLGHDVTVDGGVFLAGTLHTQPRVKIGGPVRCFGDVLIGPGSEVHGGIESGGAVRILPDAKVYGHITAVTDVHLHDGCKVAGAVVTTGDIVVHGEAETGDLRPEGRVRSE
ncbi:MAG: polymer-forming cytoskeletal protein [Euryarchaeota archaeon]|nr:polymer-forming cytoskeletal protein [Euryarchaeota archaeon]